MALLSRFFLLCIFFLQIPLFAEDAGLQDDLWVSGTLDNGLRYFIRQNAKPEKRVELRLVVNAGSILESDDQQGLAHFLEHSAFNGTQNFEESEMVDFLESLGVGFGADLNAYTSFDETVYKLRVPTDDPKVVEDAFLILADWAGGITNSDEALADERGVIIEEWRGRRGAEARVRDQQYPVMFTGSRYAERLPIGKIEVLENFDFNRLRDFYRDWYRPDLMSIIAVGDLDVAETQALIREKFSTLVGPENPPERLNYAHPPQTETKVGTFSDPELTSASVMLMWKMRPQPVLTEEDYIEDIKSSLASEMLNQRLHELTQSADTPFLQGGNYRGAYTRGGDVFLMYAAVKDEVGAYVKACEALLMEAERANIYGFTQGELDRAIASRLRYLEKLVAERENTESDKFAAEMVQHALTGEFLPGIEGELEIHQRILPAITLADVQQVYAKWLQGEDRVIMATGPAHDGETFLPADEALLAVYTDVENMTLTAYEDGVSNDPLITTPPQRGEIVEKTENAALSLIEYKLSNGVKVTLKPTDFKQDEILMEAWRGGGSNLATDENWLAARTASSVAEATGLGTFSAVELQKKLSGKLVSLSARLTDDQDLVKGSASPQDLETLMQLIYLRFTTVREDADAFNALQGRMRESVRNRLSDPKAEFSDMVEQTLTLYNPRTQPLTLSDVDAMNMGESLAFFQSRFDHAQGFHFLFTGNVDPDSFEALMETWLGSLPANDEVIAPAYLKTEFPKYQLRREMHKGIEPIAQVQMVWSRDDFEWNYGERHKLQSMVAALRIRLREELREKEGGTYHVSAWTPVTHYPEAMAQLRIAFTCNPERMEQLVENLYKLLDEFSQSPLDESYAEKVREGQLRRRETDLKENSFWSYVLPFYDWHQEDAGVIFEFESYVNQVSPERIQQTAAWMLDTPHQSVFVLMPADGSEETP